MNIKDNDILKNLRDIIDAKSKYQKVMLLYDDNVSNLDIANIFDTIKEVCIFNKLNINTEQERLNEVNDGYRTIIYLCSTESFLNLKFDRNEFVNIYLPIDNAILPYFLDKTYRIEKRINDYLLLNKRIVDISLVFSVFFNKFYNYIKNLMYFQNSSIEFNFEINELSSLNSIDIINKIEKDFEFIDIKIIAECEIDYQFLPVVDYLIITAFSLLIRSVHNHTLSMVDIYKSVKEDYALVEKFYAMADNELFINLINLNFNCINSFCKKCRVGILDRVSVCEEFNETSIKEILVKLKDYFKNSQGLFAYLYLYDIFGI